MLQKILKIFIILLLFLKANETFSQWQIISSGITDNLVDGCFVTDSTGYIISSNGTILKTINAGTTWSINTVLTGTFSSIFHVGIDTIYAGGNCIYRSDDGGNSWNLITNLSFTITDLGFFGSKTGYAIVPNYSYCNWYGLHTFDNFLIYKTLDFGSSWQLDFGGAESTSRFQFINDNSAYITGGGINIVAHCAGPWYNSSKRTNNNGSTWFSVSQPYSGHSYFSFINENIGYFVQPGNTFSINKTIDGGNTLIQSYTEIYDNTIKQCQFINEIDGYLLGKNNIYVTSSNGFGWNNDYVSTGTLNFLFKNPSNLLFGIGNNGLILKKELISSAYTDTIYRIKLNNNSLDFGFVNVDSLLTKSLSVTNTGSASLNLSFESSNDFKINFTNGSFVNNLNVSLNPFQDTIIYVQFSPLQVQHYNDTLLITADSMNTVKIPVDGNGFYGLFGDILQDTVICVDTLRIGSDITIKSSSKLTICAGTYVQIMGDFKITVEGILEALGNSINNIQFALNDTATLWNGIYINNPSYNDTSTFNYCNFILNCNNPFIDIRQGIVNVNYCNFSNKKIGAGAIKMYKFSGPCKLLISNSNIYNTKASAIECSNCDSTFISNCNIYGNTKGVSFSTVYGIFISENNIHDNLQEGVYGFGKLTIQKNKIYNNGGGIYFEGSGVRIENNEIYNNKSTFTGGISGGVNDGGAYINQNLIFNNTSISGNGAGLQLAPDNNFNSPAYVTNNTICNNQTGTNGKGNNFYATPNTSSGLDIKLFNNIIFNVFDSNNNIAWFPSVTHEINFNCINQDSINIWGQNNIDNNPKFIKATDSIGVMSNLGSYDWSLKASSHCINTGDFINTFYLLPLDFAGNQRIYNNRVDIGAFEFQGDFVEEINPTSDTIYSLSLFPNPVNNILTISVNTTNLSEITLYDVASRPVLKKEFIKITTINVRSLAQGIYIYKVRGESGLIKQGKLIKY